MTSNSVSSAGATNKNNGSSAKRRSRGSSGGKKGGVTLGPRVKTSQTSGICDMAVSGTTKGNQFPQSNRQYEGDEGDPGSLLSRENDVRSGSSHCSTVGDVVLGEAAVKAVGLISSDNRCTVPASIGGSGDACRQQQHGDDSISKQDETPSIEEKQVLGWQVALAALAAADGCPSEAAKLVRRTARAQRGDIIQKEVCVVERSKPKDSNKSASRPAFEKQNIIADTGAGVGENRDPPPMSSQTLPDDKPGDVKHSDGKDTAPAMAAMAEKPIFPVVMSAPREISETPKDEEKTAEAPPAPSFDGALSSPAIISVQTPPQPPTTACSANNSAASESVVPSNAVAAEVPVPAPAPAAAHTGRGKRRLSDKAEPARRLTPPSHDTIAAVSRSTSSSPNIAKKARPQPQQDSTTKTTLSKPAATSTVTSTATTTTTIAKNKRKTTTRDTTSGSSQAKLPKKHGMPTSISAQLPEVKVATGDGGTPQPKLTAQAVTSVVPESIATPSWAEGHVERAVNKFVGPGNEDRELPNCDHDVCMVPASFGLKADGRLVRCSRHYTGSMMDLLIRRCPMERCDRYPPIFGFPGQVGPSLVCEFHRREGMVDLGDNLCQRQGCTSRPSPQTVAAAHLESANGVAHGFRRQRPSLYCNKHSSDLAPRNPTHESTPTYASSQSSLTTKTPKPKPSSKGSTGSKPRSSGSKPKAKSGTSGGPPAPPAAPPTRANRRRKAVKPTTPPALEPPAETAPPLLEEAIPALSPSFVTHQPQLAQRTILPANNDSLEDRWVSYGGNSSNDAIRHSGYSSGYRGTAYTRSGDGGHGREGGYFDGGDSQSREYDGPAGACENDSADGRLWASGDPATDFTFPQFFPRVAPGQPAPQGSPMFELPDISMTGRPMKTETGDARTGGLRRL